MGCHRPLIRFDGVGRLRTKALLMNLYLVLATVEAGFLNLWIICYAVMLLLWGQRGEAVVAHAARWYTGGR